MTIDPFTTPVEAERAGRAKQAQDFLALAMTPERLVTLAYHQSTTRHDYENGIQAVRDALVGNAHATLAVNANLDRIASALETLARTPNEVQQLAKHVSVTGKAVQDRLADLGNEIHDLCAKVDQGVEFADSTAAATASISVSMHDLTDAVLRLSEPRPSRWWQWRRRALRQVVEGEVAQ